LQTTHADDPRTGANDESERAARVTVRNPGKQLAFLVRLRSMREPEGEEVLPVWWEDNYFELWPGETREIAVHYRGAGMGNARPVIRLDGWNVVPTMAEPAAHD
jgi:exo-1,4-beta-D-glucosaminidase